LMGLMRAYSFHAAQGRLYLPLDILQKYGLTRENALANDARLQHVFSDLSTHIQRYLAQVELLQKGMKAGADAVFLPLALTRAYLKSPFDKDFSVMRKVWILWRS
jgi:15-cis-phytoene synthase